RVRLLKNGVVEWVDPVGRQLTTEPVDHLLSTQIRVTQVGPPTAEDLAELLEWELIVAQFDEDAAPGPACTHDQHCESNEHSSTAAVGGSRPEAAMAQAVADVLRSLARAQPQESSDSLSGGLSPTAKPWHGKPQPRFGAHTCDLDRIPRPQRQGGPDIGAHRTGGSGRRAGKPGGRAGKSGLDGADSNVTIDCRFDAGGRLGVGRVRYRASRRHRRWAKYLAAGGPPF